MNGIRQQLGDDLAARLTAKKYRIVPSLGKPDRLAKPLIQLEQSAIAPNVGAKALHEVTVKVHVVTHLDGITPAADDAIDELCLEVLAALDGIGYVRVIGATKGVWEDAHLEYEIETTIIAS